MSRERQSVRAYIEVYELTPDAAKALVMIDRVHLEEGASWDMLGTAVEVHNLAWVGASDADIGRAVLAWVKAYDAYHSQP